MAASVKFLKGAKSPPKLMVFQSIVGKFRGDSVGVAEVGGFPVGEVPAIFGMTFSASESFSESESVSKAGEGNHRSLSGAHRRSWSADHFRWSPLADQK